MAFRIRLTQYNWVWFPGEIHQVVFEYESGSHVICTHFQQASFHPSLDLSLARRQWSSELKTLMIHICGWGRIDWCMMTRSFHFRPQRWLLKFCGWNTRCFRWWLIVCDFKHGLNSVPPVSLPLAMWLCSSSHQELESVSTFLESGPAFWLALATIM